MNFWELLKIDYAPTTNYDLIMSKTTLLQYGMGQFNAIYPIHGHHWNRRPGSSADMWRTPFDSVSWP